MHGGGDPPRRRASRPPPPPKLLVKWHLIFAILSAIGMAIVYGLKVNVSVAIVAMINHTHSAQEASLGHGHSSGHGSPGEASNASDALVCSRPSNGANGESKASEDGPFTWTDPQQGLVLGSYFWGYLITQLPGGWVAERFSGKWVFFGAVLLNIVPTLLTPLAAYGGFEFVIILRIIMGLGGGVTFPAMNVLISHWAPVESRSTVASIAYGGTALGTVISIPTAGIIAGNLGWEAVFYLHGGLAGIWCFLWFFLVTDSPDTHPFISEVEVDYIMGPNRLTEEEKKNQQKGKKHPPVPWKEVFTSKPVWAIIITHTLNNFGWYMLLVELPLFMRLGLGFNIQENAGLSCIPFLANWIFSIVYSNLLDRAHHHKLISITNCRKLSMAIASIIPAGCLLGVIFSGCDRTAVVVLMIIATCFYGSMFSGVFSNHVDIASNYAGTLMGISNMTATIPGFAVPAFVGAMTHGQEGVGPWHVVFYVTAGLLIFEFVIYTIMASGEEQPWNLIVAKELTHAFVDLAATAIEIPGEEKPEENYAIQLFRGYSDNELTRITHAFSLGHASYFLRPHTSRHQRFHTRGHRFDKYKFWRAM